MTINTTPILNTDSYKTSHYMMYPTECNGMSAYIESRGGRFDRTLFFGLQGTLIEYLMNCPVTMDDVLEADAVFAAHGVPFNINGWKQIVNKHGGYLPITVKAVREGSVVPTHCPIVRVEAYDEFKWLATYNEPLFLRGVWYPTTVATQSFQIRKTILKYLEKTGSPDLIDFKLHDFGARGVSSFESACIGGASHLVSFKGTDTVSALLYLRKYYGGTFAEGYSIPATEHSVITAWKRARETDAYRNMLSKVGNYPFFACVFDSYDVENAAKEIIGEQLRTKVLDCQGTLVFRPDSGNPEEITHKIIEILGSKFGFTVNEKGFRVLNKVRIIQGDGVNERTIENILAHYELYGWSADNIAFGMGGELLQSGITRDTNRWAMKLSAIRENNEWVGVKKDPITDKGKVSKEGRQMLYTSNNKFVSGVDGVLPESANNEIWTPALETVYENGKLLRTQTISEIRNLALQF